ncbi:hypothetical protein BDV93DRAFT_520463 [Ceratobasidium sp. AG-I]|nr:hypothetical protein BDV93DRAFT_520463 [Ceratobasidium sp. AG-I]
MSDFFTTTAIVDNACASGSKQVDEKTAQASNVYNQQDMPKKDVAGGLNFSMCEIIM